MIKYNSNSINKWYYGAKQAVKVVYDGIDAFDGTGGGDSPVPPTPTHDYSKDYLTFVSETDNNVISMENKMQASSISYSLDNGATWVTKQLPKSTSTNIVTLNQGQSVILKGNGGFVGRYPTSMYSWFKSTGLFRIEGNLMSIYNGDNFSGVTSVGNHQCENLFEGCTGLTTAENLVLPATTLGEGCYDSMFNGCTSLTAAPALPATELKKKCYGNMFNGCTSLITAPVLPASTLASSCYIAMFYNCSNLNNVTCLATDISASSCTSNWLSAVSQSGTFTKAATMTGWTSGTSGIPLGWTVQDAS